MNGLSLLLTIASTKNERKKRLGLLFPARKLTKIANVHGRGVVRVVADGTSPLHARPCGGRRPLVFVFISAGVAASGGANGESPAKNYRREDPVHREVRELRGRRCRRAKWRDVRGATDRRRDWSCTRRGAGRDLQIIQVEILSHEQGF